MVILKRWLQAPDVPITVDLVGAGGTGSVLLTHLARIHHAIHTLDGRELMVRVYDPDTVDEPNLGRQMFTHADVGRFKSDVLVERVNRFYGLRWQSISDTYKSVAANIVITCVDTKAAREQVFKSWNKNADEYNRSKQNYFWIDCGNTQTTANIIIGSKQYNWPSIVEHPQWKEIEEKEQGPSCSLAEALHRQDLFINPEVATKAGTWLWQALKNKRITWRAAYMNLERMTLQTVKV